MVRRLLRGAFALPLLAAGFGAASAAATGPAAPLCAQAAGANHVGIVIEHDTVVKHQCVSFRTSTILALTVLQDSGFEYATQLYNGIGEAVCQIDDVPPAGYQNCLPFSGSYWVFFVAGADGTWTSAAHGVSATTVSDGDFIGFRYDPLGGADPPPAAPSGVCPVSTPTPTPTPVPTAPPTASAVPTPTGTTSPSGTPRPAGPTPTGTPATPDPAGGSTPASSTGPSPTGVVAGVLGVSSPGASPDATLGATPTGALGSSFSPALVVAIVAVAALIGLLGIQGLRRRRQ